MRLQRSSRRRVSLVAVVASLAVVCADHEPGHPGNVHNPILVLETSMGTMKAELFLDAAPPPRCFPLCGQFTLSYFNI